MSSQVQDSIPEETHIRFHEVFGYQILRLRNDLLERLCYLPLPLNVFLIYPDINIENIVL